MSGHRMELFDKFSQTKNAPRMNKTPNHTDIFHVELSEEERKLGKKFLKPYRKNAHAAWSKDANEHRTFFSFVKSFRGFRFCAEKVSRWYSRRSRKVFLAKNYELADVLCQKALRWDSFCVSARLTQIRRMLMNSDWESALTTALYTYKFCSAPEECASVLSLAGDAAYEFGSHEAAQLLYLQALEHTPEDSRILAAAGDFYFHKGDDENALKCFLKAFHFCKTSYIIEMRLSTVCLQLDRPFFGKIHTRHALKLLLGELPPGTEMTAEEELFPYYKILQIQMAGICAHEGDIEESLEILLHLDRMCPDNPDILNILARTYFMSKQYDEAIPILNRLVEMKRNLDAAYLTLGKIWAQRDDYEKALEFFALALAENSDSAPVFMAYLSCLLQMERFEEAATFATQLLEEGKKLPEVYAIRGIARFTLGDKTKGCADVAQAWKHDPNSLVLMHNYAHQLQILGRHEESLRVCDRALSLNSKISDFYVLRAMNYLAMKEFDKARQNLDTALELNPSDENAWQYKVQLAAANHDSDEAERCLKSLLERRSEIFPAFAELATLLEKQNRSSDGAAWAENLTIQYPNDFHYFLYLATFQLDCGQPEDAMSNVEKAISMVPEEVIGYLLRAQIYIKTDRPEAAMLDFRRALDLDEDSSMLWERYCSLKATLGLEQEALDDLATILEKKPDDPILMECRINICLNMEKYVEAEKDCDRLLERNPDLDTVLLKRSLILSWKGDFEKAIQDIDKAVQINPDNLDYRFTRVKILQMFAYHQEALDEVERILVADPVSIPAQTQKILLLIAMERYREAANTCKLALKNAPNEPILWNARGMLFSQAGKNRKAIKCFTRALDFDSSYAGAYLNRAKSYIEEENPESAQDDLYAAIEIAPEWPLLYLNLALIHFGRDLFEEALADLENALKYARLAGDEDVIVDVSALRKTIEDTMTEDREEDSDDEDYGIGGENTNLDEDVFQGNDESFDFIVNFDDDDDDIDDLDDDIDGLDDDIDDDIDDLDDLDDDIDDDLDDDIDGDIDDENGEESEDEDDKWRIEAFGFETEDMKQAMADLWNENMSNESFLTDDPNDDLPPWNSKSEAKSRENLDWKFIPFRKKPFENDNSAVSGESERSDLDQENEEILSSVTEYYQLMEHLRTSRSMVNWQEFREVRDQYQEQVRRLIENLKKNKTSNVLFLSPTDNDGRPVEGSILQIRIDLD